MREKIPSEIIQLALSDASYEGCGVSITPTLINFFFGNALNENYTALHIEREKKKKLALQLIDALEVEGKKVKICFWCV